MYPLLASNSVRALKNPGSCGPLLTLSPVIPPGLVLFMTIVVVLASHVPVPTASGI